MRRNIHTLCSILYLVEQRCKGSGPLILEGCSLFFGKFKWENKYKKGEDDMPVRVEVGEEIVAVFLTGEIDHHNAGKIREKIDHDVERAMPQILRMDFGGVEFMDSSGIGLVLGRYKLMQDLNGRLELCNLPGHIKKVMRLAGIDHLGVPTEQWNKKEDV